MVKISNDHITLISCVEFIITARFMDSSGFFFFKMYRISAMTHSYDTHFYVIMFTLVVCSVHIDVQGEGSHIHSCM